MICQRTDIRQDNQGFDQTFSDMFGHHHSNGVGAFSHFFLYVDILYLSKTSEQVN